jgi:hypothetical protein
LVKKVRVAGELAIDTGGVSGTLATDQTFVGLLRFRELLSHLRITI